VPSARQGGRGCQWRTFQEFLSDARTSSGGLTYGTSGVGTIHHITMERIAKQQGVKFVHVPFKGSGETVNALLGGHIDAIADTSTWAPTSQRRQASTAGYPGRNQDQKLARRADLEGSRHRHGREHANGDQRSQRHGSNESSRLCTTPSRSGALLQYHKRVMEHG
jgi:hypothetical protein